MFFYKMERAGIQKNPSENRGKELNFRGIPLEIFSSGTAGALLVQENTRLAAGQAGAAAPWPLNVLPNKDQKAASLGHRCEAFRGLLTNENASREP